MNRTIRLISSSLFLSAGIFSAFAQANATDILSEIKKEQISKLLNQS